MDDVDLGLDANHNIVAEAAKLAESIARYQRPLGYLGSCTQDEAQRRLAALFYLANPLEARREDVTAATDISSGELQTWEGYGVVTFNGPMVSLTQLGESFLGLMLMFNKSIQGGTSDGFIDLLSAASAGKYELDTLAKLITGSIQRQGRRIRSVTNSENMEQLEIAARDRDSLAQRIPKAIEILGSDIHEDIQSDLRIAANDAHHASMQQRGVANRVLRENVTLPQGHQYQDIVRKLSHIPAHRVKEVIASNPVWLRGIYRPIIKVDLDRGLVRRFETPKPESERPATQLAKPVAGTPPESIAEQELIASIRDLPDGTAWHRGATTTRAYLRGVWYAAQDQMPSALRQMKVQLVWTEDRIREPPFVDAPIIIVRKTT